MSVKLELILTFSHKLRDQSVSEGYTGVEVRTDVIVSMNGKRERHARKSNQ